eukprot:2548145-Alexandrium_andersonii.AAC.1
MGRRGAPEALLGRGPGGRSPPEKTQCEALRASTTAAEGEAKCARNHRWPPTTAAFQRPKSGGAPPALEPVT